jgi:hypothetical protein
MKFQTTLTAAVLLHASLPAHAAIDRYAAVTIAKAYVSSGTVKDKYGRTIETSFINLGKVETIGRVYSVGLESGTDYTNIGGYRTTCAGSVQVYALDGTILSSDFTCADSE